MEHIYCLFFQFALFLPFPEGQGMLYKLVGKSIEPLAIAKISRQITAKQTFTEYFPITNWMNTNQHFKVTNQLLTPLNPKILYKISGSKDIDLQERATKDYKWSIYVVNEGLLDFKVKNSFFKLKLYILYKCIHMYIFRLYLKMKTQRNSCFMKFP